jgi:hypothetical protein
MRILAQNGRVLSTTGFVPDEPDTRMRGRMLAIAHWMFLSALLGLAIDAVLIVKAMDIDWSLPFAERQKKPRSFRPDAFRRAMLFHLPLVAFFAATLFVVASLPKEQGDAAMNPWWLSQP